MPAAEQREAFQAVLEDALEDDLSFEVVQTVHEQLRDMIETHDQDKAAEPLVVSRREVSSMLESCGVPEEKLQAFEQKYNDEFGEAVSLPARNVVEPKKFEVRTPDVVVQVNPERSDLIETRVIDGVKYVLIRAEEGVEVNGVNINIGE
jgi:xanthine/CO dehydrogenase XdhC/CoxF family maturation factor